MPFDFLGLPKDIRLCVYDFLPMQTSHTRIPHQSCPSTTPPPAVDTPTHPISISFVTKSLSCSILQTCKQIHDEALPTVRKKQSTLLEETFPPRIIVKAVRLPIPEKVWECLILIMRTLCLTICLGGDQSAILPAHLEHSNTAAVQRFATRCLRLDRRRPQRFDPHLLHVCLDLGPSPVEDTETVMKGMATVLEMGCYYHMVRMSVVTADVMPDCSQSIALFWSRNERCRVLEGGDIEEEERRRLWAPGENL